MRHIGILQTGRTNPELKPAQPDYPSLFEDLLVHSDTAHPLKLTAIPVLDGVFPEHIDAYDGYIITGSKFGVYEDHDWLPPLMDFINRCDAAEKKMVGICFGHQAIAKALGAEVVKSTKGWGAGVKEMRISAKADFMQPALAALNLIYMHQDQVQNLPEGATKLTGNDFCPIAGMVKGTHIFTLQGHPEFTQSYTTPLYQLRANDMAEGQAINAIKSLNNNQDGRIVAQWIGRFFYDAA